MGFGEDLRGELFGKLGVESNEDPLKLIERGVAEKSQGNNQGAKKSFEQAMELSKNQADKYMGQSQHRAAAEALYVQSVAAGHLGLPQSDLYTKVIDSLLQAGKSAMAFNENNRGMACAALAGMVALLDNDQDRAFEIYQEFIEIANGKENTEFLQKLMYSLGYLLDALKNDNLGGLTDAQNYMSTDLRPMLSTSKLTGFETLLDTSLRHVQDVLQSKITMPKLMVGTSLPRDIQFNQMFDFDLMIENEGEGSASSVEISLDIPEDIEVVDGKTSESLEKLDSTEILNRKLQLRFLTGDTSGEQLREIRGHVTYVDMLGNSHKQYFGPIEIEFTAVSKKEEYQSQLSEIVEPISEISSEDIHKSVPVFVFETSKSAIEDTVGTLREKIEQEAFETVEFGLDELKKSVDQLQELTAENETTQKIQEEMNSYVDQKLAEQEESLKAEFEVQKKQALEKLNVEKEEELNARIEQLKSELNELHQKEMNELKDKHQEELQESQREYESKLNQGLSNHEGKLREEFKSDKEKTMSDHEEKLTTLETKHKEELTDTKEQIRKEMTEKYESKITSLEKTIDDVKTELQTNHEKEIQELKQKYEDEISKLKSE